MYVCKWDMCWRNFCVFSLVTKMILTSFWDLICYFQVSKKIRLTMSRTTYALVLRGLISYWSEGNTRLRSIKTISSPHAASSSRVHDMTKTNLFALESIVHRYVKSWSGLARFAAPEVIFHIYLILNRFINCILIVMLGSPFFRIKSGPQG